MKKYLSICTVALAAIMVLGSCSGNSVKHGPNYADAAGHSPRFKALLYFDPTAEIAHVEFDMQTIRFFEKLTVGRGFDLDTTSSLAGYTLEDFSRYNTVIWANAMPSGQAERDAFEQYMRNGGGWVGFHAAAYNDSRTQWPWFNEFLGAGTFYCNNWPPQPALAYLNTRKHEVTKNLPKEFVLPASEFYQFNWPDGIGKGDNIEVLLSLSPKNYPIGIKDIVYNDEWPLVWTNTDYRMIYLNMGHGDDEYTDASQNLLFVNAFRWVVSRANEGNPMDLQ